MGPHPEAEKEGGKGPKLRPCWQRYQPPGQKGSFKAPRRLTTTSLQQAEQREPCRGGLHHYLAYPSQKPHHGTGRLELRVQRTPGGGGLLLAVQRQPEGTRVHYGYNPAGLGVGVGQ